MKENSSSETPSQPTQNPRAMYQPPQLEHLRAWNMFTGIPITGPLNTGKFWFDGEFWSSNDPWNYEDQN